MTYKGQWEPGFQYGHGDIVTYEGKNYKIIQPHRSQSDWAPPIVPALWERTNEGGQPQQQQQQYQPPPQQQQQPQQQSYSYGQQTSQQPTSNIPVTAGTTQPGGYTTDGGHKIEPEDEKKNWYDLDDDKKGMLLGGGLALGLAAIGGGAYYAHQKHKAEGEDEKAAAWEVQNWIVASQRRTNAFLQQGPQGPVTWVFSGALDENRNLANDLIPGGEEDGRPWFVARAPHKGGLQVGKARPGFGAFIGFKHDAVLVKQYEVLVGNRQGIRWVRTSGKLDVNSLGARPVEGGHEDNGSPLYIARARTRSGNVYPGKASTVLKGAYVTEGDDEVNVNDYEVLCYA